MEKSRKQVQALDASIEKVCNEGMVAYSKYISWYYFAGKSSIEWKAQKGRSTLSGVKLETHRYTLKQEYIV